MIIKFILFFFKSLAAIFSKLGAKYIYTKLFKLLMKYKIISILYKPIKFIFSNLVSFIKLASAIIAILSLFNVSLLYYNFDVINEANNLINEIINYIKMLYFKWFPIEDDNDIPDPVDFFQSRKDVKVIKKAVQQSTNNYWLIPVMLIGYGTLYYYNPNLNLEETLNPVISQIENKLPANFPITFVTGTFIYKFIAVSLTYITGYTINRDASNQNDRPSNGNEINPNSEETLWRTSMRLPASYEPNSTYNDRPSNYNVVDSQETEPELVTESERAWLQGYLRREEEINRRFRTVENQPSVHDPLDNLPNDEQEEFNDYFPNDNEDTPRASNTELPETTTAENRPQLDNPFRRTTRWMRQIDKNSIEIRVEDWL